jgi:hypothetical protein
MHVTRLKTLLALAGVLLALWSPAEALTILTHGKVLKLKRGDDPERSAGLVRFENDPALRDAPDPSCPATSSFEVGLHTVAANRVLRGDKIALDCARWVPTRKGWVYADPEATSGIEEIVYGPKRLRVKLRGGGAVPAPGPVGYAFVWFEVGERRFHGRFHTFRRNAARLIASRKTSRPAARGEAGFWAVMLGDDNSEANQQRTLKALARAARRDKKDGRSRFLTGMLRLYRFGQRTASITDAGADAAAELRAAVRAFDRAEPLLWSRGRRAGDSRVPGFAAAARYSLGVVAGDDALRRQGLDDLEYSIEINAFFNVFDLMTVAQAEPPGSPGFQFAFSAMDDYLSDPETFACAGEQPEICTNSGLAPTGVQASFVLFGDLYAKAGDFVRARTWYTGAAGVEAGWPLEGLAASRVATVEARVAAYQDVDTLNDPPMIGTRQQACASCHNRAVTEP